MGDSHDSPSAAMKAGVSEGGGMVHCRAALCGPYALAVAYAVAVALLGGAMVVGQPIMRTCGDTDMDGARDYFDC